MVLGVPCTMLFLALLFALSQSWGVPGLRVLVSLYLLPYSAVGAELSDDHDERSSLAAWRWGLAMLGAVATVILGFGIW